jgi:phosphomannomutase
LVAEIADQLAAEGADVRTIDGVRVETPDGWWLLRASGTESKLTVRCEADDEGSLRRLTAQVRGRLRPYGVELG